MRLVSAPPPVPDLDIEQGLSMLTNNVQGVIDLLAPEKTVDPTKKQVPWLNTEHETRLAKRDLLVIFWKNFLISLTSPRKS